MSKTLKNQLRSCVFFAFRERYDKHAAKKHGENTMGTVASYSTKDDLLDKTNQFCKWMKKKYPEIRNPQDISKRHIREFLDSGADRWTQKSLEDYKTALKKLGILAGQDWACEKVIVNRKGGDPNRGADDIISHEDYRTLLRYCEQHPSGSALAIRLERHIGVRVADVCYGVQMRRKEDGQKILHIKCKHGKNCDRIVTPEMEEIIALCRKRGIISQDGAWKFPKDGSVNRYLNRTEDKLGLKRHSFHSIRRLVAQDKYDLYRTEGGMIRSEALDAVSVWLNHGDDRNPRMILKSYIANAW